MVLIRSLSDSKFSLVFETLLIILADLNNVVVQMIFILPLISCSPSLFSRPLRTIPNAPTTIGITVTFIFLSFFSFLAKSKYLLIVSFSFIFILFSTETTKSTVIFFLLINAWLGLSDVLVSQSPREFYVFYH